MVAPGFAERLADVLGAGDSQLQLCEVGDSAGEGGKVPDALPLGIDAGGAGCGVVLGGLGYTSLPLFERPLQRVSFDPVLVVDREDHKIERITSGIDCT